MRVRLTEAKISSRYQDTLELLYWRAGSPASVELVNKAMEKLVAPPVVNAFTRLDQDIFDDDPALTPQDKAFGAVIDAQIVQTQQSLEPGSGGLPFGVGDSILIRTVTMIQVGKVRTIENDFLVLDDASWVADTGRFSGALTDGTLNEVEKCPGWVLVGRGSIVDVFPWSHPLPKETK